MGFYDVYGNVWEWTEDQFNGLPGFKTSYLYDDYSTPSFDGKHNMIMVSTLISLFNYTQLHFVQYIFLSINTTSHARTLKLLILTTSN